jgi:UDP-N-acetylmuramoyl-L-alanyl-D-glutamate--2,6-diaminopimelate ligase
VIVSEDVVERLRQRQLPATWHGEPPESLRSLATDSRLVSYGDLFCAVTGERSDGHDFVPDAQRAGAAAAVVQRPLDVEIPQLVVTDTREVVAHLAMLWQGDPAAGMRLIGVTGTNGKTTTSWIARHLLSGIGRSASLGTLGVIEPGGHVRTGELTTPDSIQLADSLADLRDDARFLTMEVSSHALDQRRVDGLRFDYAVYTSFSREHLDYHEEMSSYRDAKLRLSSLLLPDGVLILNADEPAWETLRSAPAETVSTGLGENAQVRAESVQSTGTGCSFVLAGEYGSVPVDLPLVGRFNIENALSAAAVALHLGMHPDEVAGMLQTVPQVPGRFEILSREPSLVVRDYAHTPDAFAVTLQTLRPLVSGRLIIVFGCGGDRDRGKRPLMGAVAGSLADRVIVTSDNPRSEDPARIAHETVASLEPEQYEIVLDRADAIARALELTGDGDAVLLAGKGHETYQIVGSEKLPFDEAAIVAELRGPSP